MNKNTFSYIVLWVAIFLSTGCSNYVTKTVTYKINEPVFMKSSEFRSSVKVKSAAVDIENQGKICLYEGYLYISETGKGIHIIDNRNPSKPINTGFIELLGNTDISVRNNLLYADSFIDLVWFDVSNPSQPTFKGRIEDLFPSALPPFDNGYSYDYNMCFNTETDQGVIVGWDLKERTEDIESYTGGWFNFWGGDGEVTYNDATSGTNSVNGSMSRFAFYNDMLYTAINGSMSIFDLSGAAPVKAAEDVALAWNVETLFSYKDNMFMGTPTGMYIYSVSNPLKPEFKSFTAHVFGCDPVVVHNDTAYVTIRSGNTCGQNVNQLLLVDVSDVSNPKKLYTHNMTNPKGLGTDRGMLFLCDNGLKVFNLNTLASSTTPATKAHYTGMDGFDLIPYNNTLIMIASDGIYQYDYSDINNIQALSKIAFKK